METFDHFGTGLAAGVLVLSITLVGLDVLYPKNYIPKTDQVQQGYVIPSKLEIKVENLDGVGEDEVIMKYDGKDYLFMLDEQGKPGIKSYEIRSAEVVPRE